MNEKNTAALVAAAPMLYRLYGTDTGWPMKWGFSCRDGWFQILMRLSERIEADLQAMREAGTPAEKLPHALQVKEKFGGLRFYMDRQSEKWTDWIKEAEAESLETCEWCSAPGTLYERRGYMQTMCDLCARREGFKLAEIEEPAQEIDIGDPAVRLRVAPLLKAPEKRYAQKGEARAAFMAARPLLLLNPRSPTNLEIAFPHEVRPVMEHLADRMEAELKRLVDAGLASDALPIVTCFATHKKTGLDVQIEPDTIPEEAEQEFDAATVEALVALTTLAGGVVELDEDA